MPDLPEHHLSSCYLEISRADLAHNADETRFAGCGAVPQEQLARRREKYARAKAILEGREP